MSDTAASPISASTEDVLRRRLIAWLIDALIVGVLLVLLHFALLVVGLLTLGIGWLLIGLLPAVPFAYSFAGLASRYAATPGQSAMGLTVVHHISGARPTPLEAFVSTALFYVSLTFAPILLIALVSARHRTLHDMVSGLLVVRGAAGEIPTSVKPPLTEPHGVWNMPGGTTA
jgi:uncharacterized RDD family membrane protein YckC